MQDHTRIRSNLCCWLLLTVSPLTGNRRERTSTGSLLKEQAQARVTLWPVTDQGISRDGDATQVAQPNEAMPEFGILKCQWSTNNYIKTTASLLTSTPIHIFPSQGKVCLFVFSSILPSSFSQINSFFKQPQYQSHLICNGINSSLWAVHPQIRSHIKKNCI